ncbi:MAG TPA: Hsp20/alpha crystallin family protein [Steroidobacteraceae bacterium]
MSLVRYEPWDLLNQLHREINRMFDSTSSVGAAAESSVTADWMPPADIAEFKDRWVLKFDVPGVDTHAIDITLDQGILTISGEREKDSTVAEAERRRVERPHGRFHRRFTLPDTADAANVRAVGRNGVLEVTIPKQPKAQPRRIEVKAA